MIIKFIRLAVTMLLQVSLYAYTALIVKSVFKGYSTLAYLHDYDNNVLFSIYH